MLFRSKDVGAWVSGNLEWLEKTYDMSRLQWLWSCSWTYHLWGEKFFGKNGLKIYSLIRGPRPQGCIMSIPFQGVLNRLRKNHINKLEKNIYQAAKKGDLRTLLDLGLGVGDANRAISRFTTSLESN